MKIYILFILILITNCFEFNVEHERSVYDQFMDDSDNGIWEGYAYYLNPIKEKINYDLSLPLQVNIDSKGLLIQNYNDPIDPLKFQLDCDFENKLPCGVSSFITLHGQEYRWFEPAATNFLRQIHIKNAGTQCLVLQVLDSSNTHGQPHIFCMYVEKETMQFKIALKNAYLLKQKQTPLSQLVNTVQYGDSFDIKYSHNEFFAYETKAYCKERRFKDANFNDLFKYQDIQNKQGLNCQIDLGGEIPKQMNIDNPDCCLSMKINSEIWTVCSTAKIDCETPNRQLARFLTKECTNNYPMTMDFAQIDLSVKQNDQYISEFENNADIGEWSGWGFFSMLPQIQEQSFKHTYINLVDGIIKLSKDAESNPFRAFSISSLNYDLCRGFDVRHKLCSPHEFEHMTKLDKAQVKMIGNKAILYMNKVKIGAQNQCSIMQDRISSFIFILCIYNQNQVPNFELALFTARHEHLVANSEQLDNANTNSLSDNAILKLMVSDGQVLYNENFQFKANEITRYDSQTHLLDYDKIVSNSEQPCTLTTAGLDLPQKLADTGISPECCVSAKYNGVLWFLCSMQSPCELIKKRIVKRIETKCSKDLYPYKEENSPNIDFAGDSISLPNEGHWGGYCHFAIIGKYNSKIRQISFDL